MRLFLIAIFLISHIAVYGQKPRTIFANEKDAVALFFPNTISQALTGSESFTFSYNRESPQHVGIVQGIKGDGSNLLVITVTGEVFSYRLAYREVLDTLNHFISTDDRIGYETQTEEFTVMDSLPNSIAPNNPDNVPCNTLINRTEIFRKFSAFHLEKNNNRLKTKRKKGLVLRLKDLIYHRTEVYVVIEVKNKSGIDFEIDFLKLYKVNGNKRKKSSYQKRELKPIYEHNLPKIIEVGESQIFLLTVPKFTFGDKEKLLLELKEYRGNRMLKLIYR